MKRRRPAPKWSLPAQDMLMDDRQRVFLLRQEGKAFELIQVPNPPPIPRKKRRGNA